MGYLYLFVSKIIAVSKSVFVKKCGRIATGFKNNVTTNLIRAFGCFLISTIMCLIIGFSSMDRAGIVFSVLSGVANGLFMCVWLLAATNVSVCTVEVFSMVGGVVVPLLLAPLLINGDSVTILQGVGSLMLLVAVFMFSKGGFGGKFNFLSVFALISCVICNAIVMITQTCYSHYSIGSSEDFQFYTFLFATATLIIVSLILRIVDKKSPEKTENVAYSKKVLIFTFLAIVTLYFANFFSKLATEFLPQTVFYPLSYIIAMPLTFIVDVIVFKEKITPLNVIGLVLVVTAGVLVNL